MGLGPRAAVLASVVTVALATTPVGAAAQAGAAADDTAAGWLARQLINGEHVESTPTFPDFGLTADVVFALDAAGVASDASGKAAAFLAKPDNVLEYVGDGAAESYAGPLAKLALVAESRGVDPKSFGEVDLITELGELQAPSGRYTDASTQPDQSNAFSQALAVLALHRAGGAPVKAVEFLAGSACQDGGFPIDFDEACVSDVDATAITVQALVAAGSTDAATAALTWLVGKQSAAGGFKANLPGSVDNANSTGLAAQALRAGGKTAEADKAATFLTGLQQGCTAAEAVRGAIFYAPGQSENAVRATSQAIPGILGISYAKVSAVGASNALPTVDCTTPTTTTTTSSAINPVVNPGGNNTNPVPQGGNSPALAATGTYRPSVTWLGVLLLLSGGALVVLARRRPSTR
ncbi:Prenyltransferase-like [Actinokineospora diospyrosa]|uniref:Prenyltransferase-like n=1 Tax=Actinokineospora diospyrosa TaxID=103728 RepID=A0ABT1IQ32_9PSEU|nr:Prenyltransferase-like [Actinokineospora diospyrosa]